MPDSSARLVTGSIDFSGGVDSARVPTIASPENPNGIKPNQLPWLQNGTVRGGGITHRLSFQKLCALETDLGLFQDGYMYEPSSADPYMMLQIAGRTFQIRVDTDNGIHEKTIPGDPNPDSIEQNWMCQGEQFLVIQDGQSTPLCWDGTTLFRLESTSYGPRLPTGEAMAYYMGRFWVSFGREVVGSDIVGSPATPSSGTAQYDYTDSILNMTENTYESLGGTFRMPTNSGNIRGMSFAANLDTALGEGQLFIFTRESVYSMNISPERATWQTQDEPTIRVAQINFGSVSDRCIVRVNGDLFYQSLEPGIRSLFVAIRYFGQWGNKNISHEEERVFQYNDRSLMRTASGIQLGNRLLQTVLPYETSVGTAFRGIVPLDFTVISSLSGDLPPAWEGMWEGLDFLKLLQADYGGRQRAFAVVRSRVTGGIEVWEISEELRDQDDTRITWQFETPSYTWGRPFGLKELDMLELWIDRLYGKINVKVEYREDQNTCWRYWHLFEQCAARNDCEFIDTIQPCDYPSQTYDQQYRATLVTPKPPWVCDKTQTSGKPSNLGYSFQVRVTITGSCRIRGIRVHALPKVTEPYHGMICS